MVTFQNKATLIMKVADILRGVFKPEEYDKIILPMVLLKRFDSVLADDKKEILEGAEDLKENPNAKETLKELFGLKVVNDSPFTFEKPEQDHEHFKENFKKYLNSYSDNVKNTIRAFQFEASITLFPKY
ncbi:type I restriction-modification system subunit M N-terminal domain-containing protein [Bacillus sp. FJAT-29814]|uniref:type I restriction-modification system subunit M N-terminal domain-containing protein n=1 Tax=Bacillus sp. FJAT-29814 TaxID=1729688 RepID=UPI00082EC807|nr:type I restriction-modification system subunit M N-terminal domain-containing protein [Bacillus sp. FJAT-29814]